jgi:hypothetical protein
VMSGGFGDVHRQQQRVIFPVIGEELIALFGEMWGDPSRRISDEEAEEGLSPPLTLAPPHISPKRAINSGEKVPLRLLRPKFS